MICRANRAQFSEVPLRTFIEEDMLDVALPTVQGLDDVDSASDLMLYTAAQNLTCEWTNHVQLYRDYLLLSAGKIFSLIPLPINCPGNY